MAATDEDPAATAPGAVPYLAWDDDESGEYSLTDGHIEFTTRPQGAIEYRGTVVSARELDLEFRSEITGQAARESYVFVKVKGLKHLG